MSQLSMSTEELLLAFPFLLHITPQGQLIQLGASLHKVLPEAQAGDALTQWFTMRRPQGLAGADTWHKHFGKLCVLSTQTQPPLMLRGKVLGQADGSVLLLCAAIITRIDDMHALHLGFQDFALHDPLGDMLLIYQTLQMSLADATEATHRLKARSQELETVLALNPNGIAYFTPEGVLHLANDALADMLGTQRMRLLGEHLDALTDRLRSRVHPACPQVVTAERLSQSDRPLQDQVLRMLDERQLRIDLQRSPNDGLVLRLVDVTRDFELDRVKSEFLASAAHELRTPMVSVFGFVELLLSRSYSEPRQKEMLSAVHRQSQRLITLVNELLDLARIEARQGLDLDLAPQPVASLVHSALDTLLVPGDPRTVDLALPEDLPLVHADADKTVQALTNVLSNAYKYSPDGGPIRLRIVRGELADGRPALGLQVQDEGMGMSPEQLARIFERFYRADPSGHIPGTGLGMSLVRQLMELQGGRVTVDSEAGVGTTVTLWLPLSDSPPLSTGPDAARPA